MKKVFTKSIVYREVLNILLNYQNIYVKFNGQDFFNRRVFCFNKKIYKKVFLASVIFWIFYLNVTSFVSKTKLINCVALGKSVIIEV